MDCAGGKVIAAVMTAAAAAAISTIQLFGDGSKDVLSKVFSPAQKATPDFSCGNILHGHIISENEIIDEVIVGCEGNSNFCISCHGNPFIVENIMTLLGSLGVEIVNSSEMLRQLAVESLGDDSIAVEAQVFLPSAVTVAGAKIINHQIVMGLAQSCQWWLDNLDGLDIEDIAAGALQIVADSKIAQRIISGAKIVLAGEPNSGKSTLFNCLCGSEKAMVTEIAGTTRDWLSVRIDFGNVIIELFDTAGIDEKLMAKSEVDAESQKRAAALRDNCDLVLDVVDLSNGIGGREFLPQSLTVLNKCDIAGVVDVSSLTNSVSVSAKTLAGMDGLKEKIVQMLGVAEFDLKKTVCFTARQMELMKQLSATDKKENALNIITQLLNGQVFV